MGFELCVLVFDILGGYGWHLHLLLVGLLYPVCLVRGKATVLELYFQLVVIQPDRVSIEPTPRASLDELQTVMQDVHSMFMVTATLLRQAVLGICTVSQLSSEKPSTRIPKLRRERMEAASIAAVRLGYENPGCHFVIGRSMIRYPRAHARIGQLKVFFPGGLTGLHDTCMWSVGWTKYTSDRKGNDGGPKA